MRFVCTLNLCHYSIIEFQWIVNESTLNQNQCEHLKFQLEILIMWRWLNFNEFSLIRDSFSNSMSEMKIWWISKHRISCSLYRSIIDDTDNIPLPILIVVWTRSTIACYFKKKNRIHKMRWHCSTLEFMRQNDDICSNDDAIVIIPL